MVLLLALPCAVALLVFAVPLTAVLYHRGAFTPADVGHTAQSVMGWGVGLLGLIAVKVLAPGFYARQDTGTPAKIAIAVLVLTQCFNLVFVPWVGVAGLALLATVERDSSRASRSGGTTKVAVSLIGDGFGIASGSAEPVDLGRIEPVTATSGRLASALARDSSWAWRRAICSSF